MPKVHVKWEMPYNWYSLRKLKLYFGDAVTQKVPQSVDWSCEFEELPDKIRIKLDFLSSEINLIPAHEIFLIAGLKGDSPGQWYQNCLKKKGLFLRQVQDEKYRQFNSTWYSQNTPMVTEKDWYSLFLIAACSVYATYAGLTEYQTEATSFSEFAFITGFIGVFTLASFILEKSTAKQYYLSRQIILTGLFLCTAVWASLNDVLLAWFIATLPLVILLRSLYFVQRLDNSHN